MFSTNDLGTGAGSRIQRSIRKHECEGGKVDACATGHPRSDLRLAIVAFEGVFHQTEAYLSDPIHQDPEAPSSIKV